MQSKILALSLGVFLAVAAEAQDCYYSTLSQPIDTSVNPSLDPLGEFNSPTAQARIVQFVVSRFAFQNAPVTISGLSFAMNDMGQIRYQTIRVRMAHASGDTLGNIFAANAATPLQTVLSAHDYVWPHRVGDWSEIGLQTPFTYYPTLGSLLIEIRTSGVVSSGGLLVRGYRSQGSFPSMVTAYFQGADPATGNVDGSRPLVRLCTDRASLLWLGEGCHGSGGTAPGLGFTGSAHLGSTANIVVSNALPLAPVALAFGFDTASPFPMSLASVGMPTCWQYFAPALAVGLLTNSSGVASYPQPVPLQPSLAGAIFFVQYYALDTAANAAGIVSSNLGRLQPGL